MATDGSCQTGNGQNVVAVPDNKTHGAHMGSTWADRAQVDLMWATWTLVSGVLLSISEFCIFGSKTIKAAPYSATPFFTSFSEHQNGKKPMGWRLYHSNVCVPSVIYLLKKNLIGPTYLKSRQITKFSNVSATVNCQPYSVLVQRACAQRLTSLNHSKCIYCYFMHLIHNPRPPWLTHSNT